MFNIKSGENSKMKTKIKSIFWPFSLAVLLILFFTAEIRAETFPREALSGPRVEAPDILVGEKNIITAKNLWKNENVFLYFFMADGSELLLEAQSDIDGELSLELFSYHTKVSGIYRVELRNAHGKKLDETYFRALAKETSLSRSTLNADKKSAKANGRDSIDVLIKVLDEFGNSIENNPIRLISSRPGDKISENGKGFTDKNGIAEFKIYAKSPGISTLTAIDNISNNPIEERLEVIFFTAGDMDFVGGDTVEPQSVKPIKKFEVLELPEELESNTAYDFIVKASNEDGGRVTNYTGTIQITCSDEKAEFLEEYSFMPQELGQHKFALGIKFSTLGEQTIAVNDLEDPTITGEIKVKVVEKSASAASSSDDGPAITSPTDKEQSNQKEIEIKGKAAPGSEVIIFDGNSELGITEADSKGEFSYLVSNLSDGEHVFSVMSIPKGEETGPISENVKINIDSTAPEVDNFSLHPQEVNPEEKVKFTLESEKDLQSVKIEFDDELVELTEEYSGIYSASIVSRGFPGEYPISATLVDAFGNEKKVPDIGQIKIKEIPGTDPEDDIIDVDPTPATGEKPTAPNNLKAEAGNSKVSLNWDLPLTSGVVIDHFKIYFGVKENDLNQSKETTTRTSAYTVDGLINGIDYYFSVVAVAADGTESNPSNIASAMPIGASPGVIQEANTEVQVEENADSGPEIFFVLILALGMGFQVSRRRI